MDGEWMHSMGICRGREVEEMSQEVCKWYHVEYHECMKATKVLGDSGINMKGLMGCPKNAHYRNNDCLGNLFACHCNVYEGKEGGRE